MKTALLAVVLVGLTGSAFGQDLTPPPAPPVLEPFVPMPTPTFHVEKKVRPVLYPGLALLAVGQLIEIVYATALANEEIRLGASPDVTTYLLYVPLVGPAIGHAMFKSCRCAAVFNNSEPHRFMIMAVSTSMQVAGLVLSIVGALARNPVAVFEPPGLSITVGAPGSLMGMSLVFRN